MRAFLWPTSIKAEPHGIARLGRVLHWFFVARAIACVVGGANQFLFNVDEYNRTNGLAFVAFGGGGFFLFGRALRYIFSGE